MSAKDSSLRMHMSSRFQGSFGVSGKTPLVLSLFIGCLFAAGAFFYATPSAEAAVITWDGGGSTENWSEDANWSGNTQPGTGDVATFDSTSTKSATIDESISVQGIDINSGYTGTITQAATFTVTVGTGDFDISAGTFTGGDSSITMNDAFTVSGGTFTSTTGTLSVTGAFTVSSGTFSESTGTVTATGGTATWNVVTSETFNNLIVNKTNATNLAITSGDTLVVTGTLTLTEGAVTTGTIDTRGAISQASTFDGGSATIDFGDDAGADTYTINGGTTPNIELDAAADANDSISLAANATFTSLTITSGFSGTIPLSNAGNFTPTFTLWSQAAGTYDASAQSSWNIVTLTISAGTFTAPTLVTATGGSSTWNINSSQTFDQLTINKTASNAQSITSGDTLVVTGTFTLTDGLLNTGTVDARGAISQANTFDGGSAIIDFGDDAGSDTYTIAGGTSPVIRLNSTADASDSISVTSVTNTTIGGLTVTSGFPSGSNVPLTNSNNVTITFSDFNMASGIHDASGQSAWNFSGDVVISGGTFTPPTLVTMTSSPGSLDVNSTETFNQFTVNRTSATTLGANDTIVVTGALILTNGTLQTATASVDARSTITQASTFDGGTATIDFGDDGVAQTYTINGGITPNIELDSAGDANDDIDINAAVEFDGFTVTAGFSGTVPLNNPSDFALTFDAFTFAAGTYNASAQSSWTFSGGCTFSGGTFTAPNLITAGGTTGTWDVNSAQTFVAVTINRTSALTMGTNDTITTTGTLTLTNGTLNGSGAIWEAQGNVVVGSGWDGGLGTGTLRFGGSATQTFDLTGATGLLSNDIAVNKTGGQVNMLSALVLDLASQDLTIQEGTFNVNGQALTVNGSGSAFTVEDGGTFMLQGAETFTLNASLPTLSTGSTVTYKGDGDAGADTYTVTTLKSTYHHLTISSTDGATDTFQLGAALDVNGNFTNSAGTFDVTTSNHAITLAGNWSNSGTFTARSGTVTLDADASHSVSGTTTFNNLTLQNTTDDTTDVTITFASSATQTINGTLTLDGLDINDRLLIVASSGGSAATINFAGSSTFSGNFLTITDNTATDNSTGVSLPLNPADSTNGGNTSGWFPVDFTGVVYSDEGITNIGTGITVRLLVNGADVSLSDDTDASGVFSMDISGLTLSNGDVFTVYLDDETPNGVTVTRYTSGIGSIDVYQNFLIVRHEDAGPITNTNLDTADNADPGASSNDISSIYTVSGGTLSTASSSIELLVNTGDTFTPGGAIDAAGTIDINGTLTAAANAVSVAGHFDNGGTFTHTGTLTFDGTSAQTFTPGGSSIGSDVVITNTSAAVSLSANALNIGANDLTINTSAILALAGQNLTASGTFSNSGTVRARGSETISLTPDTDSGTFEFVGDADAASDTFTLADLGTTDYFNLTIATTDSGDVLQSGAAKSVAGALVISAGTYSANTNTTSVTGLTTVSGGVYLASSATQTLTGLTVSGGTFTGSSGTVDVNGTLTVSSGVMTAPSGSLTIQGNFAHSSGTFTHNSGTVTFDANANHTISGSSTFNNLTLQDTSDNATDVILTVTASTTQTIVGTLTLDGLDTSDRLNIVSSSGGTAATTNFSSSSTFSGDFLDITDNVADDNSSGVSLPINPADSVNGGNASGWFISAFGGVLYFDEGVTTMGANKTVRLLKNGADTGVTDDTDSSGVFSLNISALAFADGDVLTFYIDDESENGVTVTRYSSSITTVDVYENFLVIRHEDAGPVTNTNLDTANNADPGVSSSDISSIFNVSGGTLTTASSSIELLINSGETFTPGGAIDAAGTIDINGTLNAEANAVSVARNFDNGGTFTHTGTLTFDGTVAQTFVPGGSAIGSDVVVANTSAAVTVSTNALDIGANDLTINTSAILSTGGQNLTASGTYSNNGTLRVRGSETLTFTQDTNSGTFEYLGDSDSLSDTFTVIDFGGTDYFNLSFAPTDNIDTFQSAAAKSVAGTFAISRGTYNANGNTTTVTGAATISGGTYTASTATQTVGGLTISGGTVTGSSGTIDVNGSVVLSSGTFTAPSGSLTISGNFTHSSGTFTHNSGTVTLDADTSHTVSGSTTWNSLTLQDTSDNATDVVLTIEAGSTQTIVGTLTLDGLDASDRLNIVSSSGGSAGITAFTGSSVFSGDFLDITDNTATDNSSGISLPINPANSVNGGNAAGWFLTTFTGVVYSDEGTTNIGTGITVRLLKNGADTSVTDDTDASGVFSLDISALTFVEGDVLTFYLDDETPNGVAVSRFAESIGSIDVYQNFLIVRHEDAGPITNTNLDTADNADPGSSTNDISSIYSVSGGTLSTTSSSIELLVNTGDTYTPGGAIDAAGNIDINGTLSAAANAINVAGHFDNGGTLTHTGTLTFDGTSAQTFTPGGSSIGSDVVIANTSAAVSLSTNALNIGANDLTVNTSAILALAGQNLTASGTFSNNGTLRVQGGETVSVTQDTNSGTYEYVGDGDSSADTFTITDFGGTDYFNFSVASVDSGDTYQISAAKVIAGTFRISAGTYNANTNTTAVTGTTTISGGVYSASTATQTFTGLTISGGTVTGSSGTIDVNGNVLLSSGTFTAPSGSLTLQGNITRSGGTFTHNSGSVTFDANADHTITGSLSWNNLTLQDSTDNATDVTLTVESGSTQTINGALTLDGLDESDRLNLVASVGGTEATTAFEGTSTFTGDYLDISDNTATDNSSGVATPIDPANSTNSGNATGWFTAASSGGGSSEYIPPGGGGAQAHDVEVTYPNGGEILAPGEHTIISWTATGIGLSYVNIALSLDGGLTYTTFATDEENDGFYSWTVPNVVSSRARILVEGTDRFNLLAYDTSDDNFSILPEIEEVPDVDNDGVPDTQDPVIDADNDGVADGGSGPGGLYEPEQISPGDYIKGVSFETVFWVDANLQRHPFYDAQTYFTYETSFDKIKVMADESLSHFTITAPRLPKPGVILVKIVSRPEVYYVDLIDEFDDQSYQLHWLPNEEIAAAIVGEDWADKVIDLPPTVWIHYKRGDDYSMQTEINRDLLTTREALNSR